MPNRVEAVTVVLDPNRTVSGLLQRPPEAAALFVMAHGAGAGMTHPFMAAIAQGLAEQGIATLRYQFPYMEAGSKRTGSPAVAQQAVRAAAATAHSLLPAVPLFAGGKSFGARMTSVAQAESPLPAVRGLIFLGFPLHPANRPSDSRAAHLSGVHIPMLFLQGTRDSLAEPSLLAPLVRRLGDVATLSLVEHGDHSFHVPKRATRSDAQVLAGLCDTITAWIAATARPAARPARTAPP
ncbi:MAG: alpha/beta family hydrolase [Rhodopila sp.]